jgi:hypothetical protein
MIFLISSWARAFAVTVLVEVAVASLLLGPAWSWRRRVAVTCLAQLASHPAVWFIFPAFEWPRIPYLAVAETWAVVVETAVYRLAFPGLRTRRAFAVSLAANALSYGLGLLLRAVWPAF